MAGRWVETNNTVVDVLPQTDAKSYAARLPPQGQQTGAIGTTSGPKLGQCNVFRDRIWCVDPRRGIHTSTDQIAANALAFGGTPVDYAVYEGLAIAYIPVTIAADAKPGEVDLMIRPVFQACDDTVCLAPSPRPGSSDWDSYGVLVEFNVVSLSERTTSTPPDPAIFDSFDPGVFARGGPRIPG